jgi:phenylacetate-CoA ligase
MSDHFILGESKKSDIRYSLSGDFSSCPGFKYLRALGGEMKMDRYRYLASSLLRAYDTFKGRQVHTCQKILEKTQWMNKETLTKLKVRKLKALLQHAYENVPFYHQSFKESGFRPADFNRLEELRKIPILQRSSIKLRRKELSARNVRKADLERWRTNGTTAAPLQFFRPKIDVSWGTAAELRGYSWAGFITGDKSVFVGRMKPGDHHIFENRIKLFLSRAKLLNSHGLSEKSLESFCSRIKRFKPDYMYSRATPITNLVAVYLLENNPSAMHLKAVFTTGQTLLPHYRRNIEEAFKCKVYNWYGTAEMSHVAAQCGYHDALHITEENVLVETLKNGEPAAPGEEAKVLLTNLNNFAMPFIRYDIGDSGVIVDDECSCGRKLQLFNPIGRHYETFVHSNGAFTVFRDVQTVLEDVPVKDFQIIQESLDEIVIRLVTMDGYTEAHTESILKNITRKAADIAKVRVEVVDSLQYVGSGKIHHLVSKIPTKYS